MADQQRTSNCEICGIEETDFKHTKELHGFNQLLYLFNKYRKPLVKNREGIEITQDVVNPELMDCVSYEENKGKLTVKVTMAEFENVGKKIGFTFVIRNDRAKTQIHLTLCSLLYPVGSYRIEDELGVVEDKKFLAIKPKCTYTISVFFEPTTANIGEFFNCVAFKFQAFNEKLKKDDTYVIFRTLLVRVQDLEITKELGKSTHYKAERWNNKIRIIKGPGTETKISDHFPIPRVYLNAIMAALNPLPGLPERDRQTALALSNRLGRENHETGQFEPNLHFDNYSEYFHILLWLNEAAETLSLQQYNMSEVTLKVVFQDVLELEVEGLAEKRPSLLAGDTIKIRLHNDQHTAYEGRIKIVNDRTIWIHKVDSELIDMVTLAPSTEYDVAFQLGRLAYERKHRAVDACFKYNMRNALFPDVNLSKKNINAINGYQEENIRFFNPNIKANNEQRIAVMSILKGTSHPAPYIVFGPPGTGKTITIVEAILQIKTRRPTARILICAPSNAACDMLTIKLTEHNHCTSADLIRVHAESRPWKDVPPAVHRYSNRDRVDYVRLDRADLLKYRAVIATLVLAGKFAGAYHPDYVFVDEAAQAQEPEAAIALALAPAAKVVLAGDPRQLGPICQSRAAERRGLGRPLLSRLLEREVYKGEDPRFICMLRLNYRAHPAVLAVPNELFYGGKLQAVNRNALNDPIATVCVASMFEARSKSHGFPVEFYAVVAKEQRQGKSPSYYNVAEADVVIKYVVSLMRNTRVKVRQEDVGVISPYIRQVQRLKEELRRRNYGDVEVGTTEAYQGREKRVVIISTVRGQHDLLLYDRKYDLGFVKNEKRMNVALTRAVAKLVIIGNPTVLNSNVSGHWRFLIEYCRCNGSVFGAPFRARDSSLRNEICNRVRTYDSQFGD